MPWKQSPVVFGQHELAMLNENLGDFPDPCGLDSSILAQKSPASKDAMVGKGTPAFSSTYGLKPPGKELFNLNIGAMEMVEKLCSSGDALIFHRRTQLRGKGLRSMLGPYI